MAVTVQSVIDRVQATLQDTTGVRWPVNDELVLWVNDAQREIAVLKPDATAKNVTVTLATGTKQEIPSDGNRLLRVVRNMSSGQGRRAIRLVSRDVLDAQTPNWHDPTQQGDTAFSSVVKHYVYDEQNPRNFYVFPGVSSGGSVDVEIVYSSNPATVTASDNLGVPDMYSVAIMNYVLYMAYMKDSEYAGSSQRASNHYQLFLTIVTGKSQIDGQTTPNFSQTRPAA